MITVAFVKWGDKYDSKYVYRLQKMVSKNLNISHKFICITDKKIPNINCIVPDNLFDLEGWWSKMFLWKKGILTGKILYLDLDTVIQNNIDELINYSPNKLCGVYTYWNDMYTDGSYEHPMYRYKTPFNSSVMVWNAGDYHWVWDKFEEDPNWYIMKYYGDDKFLGNEVENKTTFKEGWIYSNLYGIDEKTETNSSVRIENGRQTTHYYPEKKICLLNGPTNEYYYKPFEKYWND